MKAVVYRAVGDVDFAEAVMDGMTRVIPMVEKGHMIVPCDDWARAQIHAQVKKKPLKTVRREIRRKYPIKRHGALYRAVWGIIGLACVVVYECYDRLSAWNRR